MKFNLKQAVQNPVKGLVNAGKRVFPGQASSETQKLVDSINDITGLRFDTLGEFFGYYRDTYMKTAYQNLTPSACITLAMGNPWISGAIDAIAEPISAARMVAAPVDPEVVNDFEILYLQTLLDHPNPLQPNDIFINQLVTDILQTGAAYVEVNRNEYGFIGRLDRVAPYKIEPKKSNGITYFIRTDTGYRYTEDTLICIFNPNPFSNDKGLSKLVALCSKLMLDEALTEHNLRFFVKDVIKGVLSFSTDVNYDEATKEIERLKEDIKDMEEKGDSGNLVVYGATFQALAMNNRDMLTPEIQQTIIDAVKAVFHVPQSAIGFANGGSIGNGEGESQDDMMNKTLTKWSNLILSYLNFRLLDMMGIKDTHITFENLTKTDEVKQSSLDTEYLNNGTTTINRVLAKRGEELFDDPLADEPLIAANRIPLSALGTQQFTPTIDPNGPPTAAKQSVLSKRINQIVKDKKPKGVYIVRETADNL